MTDNNPAISPAISFTDKAELRQNLRSKRRTLPDRSRAALDKSIRKHIALLAQSRGVESIAVYWPFDGEPDITLLCKQWINASKDVALPVISAQDDISTQDDHAMNFHHWGPATALKRNQYGICEPQLTAAVPLSSIDMLLMPLVAYDCNGGRIGMGSGYYDRYLQDEGDATRPIRVGIAYSLQEIAPFKKNDWDIPLHGVVNEHGWVTFST